MHYPVKKRVCMYVCKNVYIYVYIMAMSHWSSLLAVSRILKYIITYLLHNMAVSGGHYWYIFFCIPAVNYNLADLAGCFIRSEWCQFAARVRRGALSEVMVHRVPGDVSTGSNMMWSDVNTCS